MKIIYIKYVWDTNIEFQYICDSQLAKISTADFCHKEFNFLIGSLDNIKTVTVFICDILKLIQYWYHELLVVVYACVFTKN